MAAVVLAGLGVGCGLLIGDPPEGTGSSGAPPPDGAIGVEVGADGGAVVRCTTPADCPRASNPCVVPACTDQGQCAEVSTGSSAPLPTALQDAGTCYEKYCDRGQVLTRDAPSCGKGGICKGGVCSVPPSCDGRQGAGNDCGSNVENCCASITVPGGTFKRRFDGVGFTNDQHPATVSSFRLDKFEVTLGRLRAFFDLNGGTFKPPPPGSGAHPKVPGSGWLASWDGQLFGKAPDNTFGGDGRNPASDSWFVAFAFCAWDGGRLPTEAEWGFVASGGAEQRVYPWSSPPGSVAIDVNQAIFAQGSAQGVGTATGTSAWGHYDLAGNVREWVRDQPNNLSSPPSCVDCAFIKESDGNAVTAGGQYNYSSVDVRSAFTDGAGRGDRGRDGAGFRCARDL